jgi:hypothetical protein
MTVLSFDAYVDKQLDREALANIWIERDALIDFLSRSPTHVYFVKFALANYSEHVASVPEDFSDQWHNLAQEFWAA